MHIILILNMKKKGKVDFLNKNICIVLEICKKFCDNILEIKIANFSCVIFHLFKSISVFGFNF